ncbi:hypothetical protein F0H41_18200 [Vibrio cholerae]|nr:hypothetical protein F0H41_18200 [Vibrio cholerae]KAA1004959.1 hypothetical protein F0H40_18200 [Vibrio cholerae]KAA1012792.1 hypothetical protein F0H43_18265 [Vibrio cholerae]KAA1019397.1 hypothetical protein F0H42_18105 [Vibrio cholerae]KAA1023117.1 hypothetical protein F0H44_18285 [Vibrio cholerae]
MVSVVVIEFSGMRCQPLRRALAALVNTIKLYFIEVVFWLKSQITVLCPIPLNSGILELL